MKTDIFPQWIINEEVDTWKTHRNNKNSKINWQFTNKEARVKLKNYIRQFIINRTLDSAVQYRSRAEEIYTYNEKNKKIKPHIEYNSLPVSAFANVCVFTYLSGNQIR